MTDGIIQQAFKIEKERHSPYSDYQLALDRLQQELIEKITQDFEEHFKRGNYILRRDYLKTLIGDNKDV